jgi:uncharacterized membrane protein YfcA
MIVIALAAGVLVGLSLGALGGGGSILTVPVLVYLLHLAPHAATTASLLVVGLTALTGTLAHTRAGRVRWAQGLAFGLLGTAGSIAGSRLSAAVDPHLLLAAFAALLVVAAAAMAIRQRHDAGRQDTPGPGHPRPLHRASRPPARIGRIVLAATAVGLLTGFFGVGGGFLVVPALVLALAFDMPTAVGTSLLVIAVNSATALAARTSTAAHLDWPVLAAFTATACVAGLLGGPLVSRVAPEKLTAAFTVLLVAVAAYTGARSLPHLL